MAKYLVMIGRLCVSGSHRQEVGNFCIESAIVSSADPRIEDVLHVPIAQVPTSVARNILVAKAQERRVDILFMVDDDMRVPPGFFKTAIDFLLSQKGPAMIGVPYCCAPPREDVVVFEWASGESATRDTPWAIANITREDAARRTGIEQVANIGTGCVAYTLSCFDAIDHPHYDYGYADHTHTRVVETEDAQCHRRLHYAGVPIYCDWDHWADHYKVKRVGKPAAIGRDDLMTHYANELAAERRVMAREEAEKKSAAPGDWLSNTIGSAGHFPPDGDPYTFGASHVGFRPELRPQAEPFTPGMAAFWAASVEGWMHPDELFWLAEEAARLNPGDLWVEVGVWKGRSMAAVALSLPAGTRFIGVDTFEGSPGEECHQEARDCPGGVYAECQRTAVAVNQLRSRSVVELWRRTSLEHAAQSRPARVVFIDGAHDYESVKADLRAWVSKIEIEGLLAGHDRNEPGVKRALEEFFPGEVMEGPGSIWCVRVWKKNDTGGYGDNANGSHVRQGAAFP